MITKIFPPRCFFPVLWRKKKPQQINNNNKKPQTNKILHPQIPTEVNFKILKSNIFSNIKILACLVRKCTKGSCVLAVLTRTNQATVNIPQLFLEFMENMLNLYSLWFNITISFMQHSHIKKRPCTDAVRAHLKITIMSEWIRVGEHRSLLFPLRHVWYVFCLFQS